MEQRRGPGAGDERRQRGFLGKMEGRGTDSCGPLQPLSACLMPLTCTRTNGYDGKCYVPYIYNNKNENNHSGDSTNGAVTTG